MKIKGIYVKNINCTQYYGHFKFWEPLFRTSHFEVPLGLDSGKVVPCKVDI